MCWCTLRCPPPQSCPLLLLRHCLGWFDNQTLYFMTYSFSSCCQNGLLPDCQQDFLNGNLFAVLLTITTVNHDVVEAAWYRKLKFEHLLSVHHLSSTVTVRLPRVVISYCQCTMCRQQLLSVYRDGATRPLPRDGGVEELYGDPTIGPRPKFWTRGQKWKK